jgi:hypothetical protein
MPSLLQQGSPILVDLPLLSINKSILAARTPISSPPRLLISSSRRNPRRGLTVTYLEVGGLGVESIFNKNVIKLEDDEEYIKEAADTIAMLRAKQGYNYKDNVLAHLKASLNRTTKIKQTKIIKLLRS